MANYLHFDVFLCVIFIVSSVDVPTDCKCSNPKDCNPIDNWNTADREVIIATKGDRSDYTQWMWESITSVLQLKDRYSEGNELMCYAHSKGSKYGFVIDMPVIYDVKDSKLTTFIDFRMEGSVKMHNPDLVALDLLELLGDCNNTENHINPIVGVVTRVINETRTKFPKLKFLCVMPWKPPCYEYNCGVVPALQPFCDGIIISPDSFTTYCPTSCRARATVPFTKLFDGLDEYEASGIHAEKLILGIPWYGYNYTCQKFSNNSNSAADNLCTLKTKMVNKTVDGTMKQVEVCDIENSRDRLRLGDFYDKNPYLLMDNTVYSRTQQAPSITGKDAKNNTHMIWFEDFASLTAKYSAVYHGGLKGCLVYTGDDLSKTTLKTGKQFNTEMFAWLLHTVLATSTHDKEKPERNVAGLVAGVGVCMFVLGALLGAIIACIRFRQKGKLQPPFRKDYHKADHQFHDEDPDL